MKITIYSTNNCGGCEWTKAQLDNKGLTYEEIKVTPDDTETINDLRGKGYVGFPVVNVNNWEQGWSGVNPQAIEELEE